MDYNLSLQKIIQSWINYAHSEAEASVNRNYSLNFTKDLACALVGARRSGKSTIAIQAIYHQTKNFLYINFEDPFFSEHTSVQVLEDLIEEYFVLFNKRPDYIIYDEIHNIPNWERWARKFIDQKRGFLVITGSSAKMLSSELSSSLTGRNLTHEVWPLSFTEYLQFLKIIPTKQREAFANYLKWGGFPRVVLETNEKIRNEILQQYYSDSTLKDVIKRNEIRDPRALLSVFNYYLANISSLHSYNKIKNAFGLSAHAPIAYSHALMEAFLIFEVSLYSKNLKIQSRNPKKIYAIDNGFRNANATSSNEDRGKNLENVVFLEYRKRGYQLYYHKEQFECDFLITEKYKPIKAIQVTESLKNNSVYEREIDGLKEAMEKHNINEGLIITLNEEGVKKTPAGSIKIVSAWKHFAKSF